MSALAETFQRDGVVQGLEVLDVPEATRLREAFERVEQRLGSAIEGSVDPAEAPWRQARHPLQRIFQALALHPRVREHLSRLLGPDLLVRNGDVFIKSVGSAREIGWHVDTAIPWKQTSGIATCWIGLTRAGPENGGLQYLRGSHRHVFSDGPPDRWNLTLTPEMMGELDLSTRSQTMMVPGQAAVHAFRTVHRSEANQSSDRRIGLVLRVMSAQTSPEAAECGQAFLVQGDAGAWKGRLRPEFPISWSVQ